MKFFKTVKLYRIITTEQIEYYPSMISKLIKFNYMINDSGIGYHTFNYIPKGISGWVVKWMEREWFLPDDNQEGLEHFVPRRIPNDELNILISIKKLKGYYVTQE